RAPVAISCARDPDLQVRHTAVNRIRYPPGNDREDPERICFPRSRRPMARLRRIHAAVDALRKKLLPLRLLVERLAAPVAHGVGVGFLPNRISVLLMRAIEK